MADHDHATLALAQHPRSANRRAGTHSTEGTGGQAGVYLGDARRTRESPAIHELTDARPHPAASAVAVLGMAVGAFLLLYATAVLTPAGQLLDTMAMTALTDVGADAWAELLLEAISPASLLAGTGVLAWCTWRGRGLVAALTVATVALGTALIAGVLKGVLVRPELLADASSNSLPSGHVAAVAGLAVAAWIATDRDWRPTVAVMGGIVVSATGFATMTLGWHRPSDCVASALVAVGVGAVASLASSRAPDGSTGTATGDFTDGAETSHR